MTLRRSATPWLKPAADRAVVQQMPHRTREKFHSFWCLNPQNIPGINSSEQYGLYEAPGLLSPSSRAMVLQPVEGLAQTDPSRGSIFFFVVRGTIHAPVHTKKTPLAVTRPVKAVERCTLVVHEQREQRAQLHHPGARGRRTQTERRWVQAPQKIYITFLVSLLPRQGVAARSVTTSRSSSSTVPSPQRHGRRREQHPRQCLGEPSRRRCCIQGWLCHHLPGRCSYRKYV